MSDKDYGRLFAEFAGEECELIPLLQRTQQEFGFIPEEAVNRISRFLRVSENQIFGIASFYSQFKFIQPGRCTVKVCMGTACHVRGSQNILDEFRRWLNIEPGETSDDTMFTLETVNCVGACALGPIAVLDGDYHGQMRIKTVQELIQKYRAENKEESEVGA